MSDRKHNREAPRGRNGHRSPEPCTHHWLVDPPSGRVKSRARCRHCGETRDFPIVFEDARLDLEARDNQAASPSTEADAQPASAPATANANVSRSSESRPGRIVSNRTRALDEERGTRQSITVEVPVEDAYRRWSRFEDFPRFMDGVRSVRRRARHLGWQAEICGKQVEWSAEITEEEPNRRIAWESTGGRFNSGNVTFIRLGPRSTRIDVQIDYSPQDVAAVVGDVLGPSDAQLHEDLECFKELVESAAD